ncbi:MAG: carboxymuconolactone decarboxylase family protein [Stenotrophobium sp.]
MNHDLLEPEGGWLTLPQARMTAPKPAERGAVFRALSLASRRFGKKEIPDIFPVFHINPRLFWGWLFFASRLMPYGRLPAKDREKIILRTAWLCRSRYEWGQHVDIALSVGVSDEEILRLSRGPQACADAHERALLLACDELVRDKSISDTTWEMLAQQHNPKRLIEITILIGHYVMVAGFLNSTGILLEPPAEETLEKFHERIRAQINRRT